MSTILLKNRLRWFLVNPVRALWFVVLLVALMIPFGCTVDAEDKLITSDQSKTQIVDDDGDIILIDRATSTITVISFTEREIHEGNAYTITDVVDQANGAVRDIQITTPNTLRWSHFFFNLSTESELEWFFYEDVTINVGGWFSVMNNMNRNSSNTATLWVATIDNANIGEANADTSIAGAVEIYHGIAGGGKDAGEFDHDHELILKQNTDYTIRLIANAAGYITYHLDWNEHINRN